jgi:hypothetical protein
MDYSKLVAVDAAAKKASSETVVEAIIKVKLADYIPESLEVRSRIDELMFTTRTTKGKLEAVRKDPKVQSVQESEPIKFVEPRGQE